MLFPHGCFLTALWDVCLTACNLFELCRKQQLSTTCRLLCALACAIAVVNRFLWNSLGKKNEDCELRQPGSPALDIRPWVRTIQHFFLSFLSFFCSCRRICDSSETSKTKYFFTCVFRCHLLVAATEKYTVWRKIAAEDRSWRLKGHVHWGNIGHPCEVSEWTSCSPGEEQLGGLTVALVRYEYED